MKCAISRIFFYMKHCQSVGFCRVSRVEGKMSRVEGKMSSVEGKMSRVH